VVDELYKAQRKVESAESARPVPGFPFKSELLLKTDAEKQRLVSVQAHCYARRGRAKQTEGDTTTALYCCFCTRLINADCYQYSKCPNVAHKNCLDGRNGGDIKHGWSGVSTDDDMIEEDDEQDVGLIICFDCNSNTSNYQVLLLLLYYLG
jgi:hypothetical protein